MRHLEVRVESGAVRIVLRNRNIEGAAAGFIGNGAAGIVMGELKKGRHGAGLHLELGYHD
jgi:hypothetical protein